MDCHSDSTIAFPTPKEVLYAKESGIPVDSLFLSQLARDTIGGCDYEVTFAGDDDLEQLYSTCQKHPQHSSFVPIGGLRKEVLPEGYQLDELVSFIRSRAALATRVMVNGVSQARPDAWPSSSSSHVVPYPCSQAKGFGGYTRTGTGTVEYAQKMFTPVQGPCPCPECVASGNPCEDWWEVRISTATHLVFDDVEASMTTVDWFYDDDDDDNREGRGSRAHYRRLYGSHVCENPQRIQDDRCILVCTSHDAVLGPLVLQQLADAKCLQAEWSRRVQSFFRCHTAIVAFPHGVASKCVSIGQIHHVTVPVGPNSPMGQAIPFRPGMTYRLPCRPCPASNHSASADSDGDQRITNNSNCGQELSAGAGDTNNSNNINTTAEFLNRSRISSPFLPKIPRFGTAHSPSAIAEELPLPPGATFALPPDALYARKYSFHKGSCFTFPPGTRCTLVDGCELPLPPDTEFLGWPLEDVVVSVSYSTPTCPGSSGATVFTLEPRRLQNGLVQRSTSRCLDIFYHRQSVSGTVGQSGNSLYINPQPDETTIDGALDGTIRAKA